MLKLKTTEHTFHIAVSHGNSISLPPVIPIAVILPNLLTKWGRRAITAGAPLASTTRSAPRPLVNLFISSTKSTRSAMMISSAPIFFAIGIRISSSAACPYERHCPGTCRLGSHNGKQADWTGSYYGHKIICFDNSSF